MSVCRASAQSIHVCLQDATKICTEPRAETSRLDVGDFSEEPGVESHY